MHGYGEDLAYIHHQGFATFVENRGPQLIALLRKHGVSAGRVVDLGCGSGIFARQLVDEGFDVLGLDSSPAMVRLARKQAPRATFRVASFVGAALPKCDAVTAVGEVFNYTRAKLLPVFRRVRSALKPGGVFALDFAGPGRASTSATRSFMLGTDWAVLVKRYEHGSHLTRVITAFRKAGRHYRRSDETHELALYPPARMLALLRAAGFRARLQAAFGPGHYAAVAQR